ncbi:zinc finger matrin-type protein 5-like [Athalia rosae]|uniref:zinc finger matrin-type protein 5-like n=1 Tax=Athalia rosae TaxID=37344 RepID=UPI002034048D|nr:zinc finger matrin-type protein 5-like [Athalia rosae]
MGKRYYCDYCDRSFKDDPEARKKHLTSLQHARNRMEHYDQFKDAATILQEESTKLPCKRFMTQGDCAFGNGCRFSHYSPYMLWELKRHVWTTSQNSETATITPPRSSDVIREFFENVTDENSTQHGQSIISAGWNYPIELQNYPNLPPSLWPITPKSVGTSDFGKWGL